MFGKQETLYDMLWYNVGLCRDDFKNPTKLVLEEFTEIVKRKGEEKEKSDIAAKTWKCFILQKHLTKNPVATKSYRKIPILRNFQCNMKPKMFNNWFQLALNQVWQNNLDDI